MVKDFLQGRPLGHPLHTMLVHFPIGLFLLSFVLDIATWIIDADPLVARCAFHTIVGGIVTALIAAVPGFADWSDIRRDHPGRKAANAHMWLNLAAVVLYAVNLYVRYDQHGETPTPVLPLLLSLVGISLLSVSGWLGGYIIYDDGISVGRHRRRSRTPEKTLHPKATAGEQFVAVARESELGEGETLRAEVGGYVMTIVRLDGRLYAFQEFCTHRYGPLSEGTFHNGQVVCPWHRSCFDVRTGKVTEGPAKVDLKRFDVEVRDGQIAVRVPNDASSPA